MTRAVAVTENDLVAGTENLDVWNEGFVALIDDARRRGVFTRSVRLESGLAFAVRGYHGIPRRFAVTVVDANDEVASRRRGGRQKQHGHCK